MLTHEDFVDYLVFLLGEEPLKVSRLAYELLDAYPKERKENWDEKLVKRTFNVAEWKEGFVIPAIYEEVHEGSYFGNDWLTKTEVEKEIKNWIETKARS